MEDRVIKKINRLSNYDYWLLEDSFMNMITIAQKMDNKRKVTNKEKEALKAFLSY